MSIPAGIKTPGVYTDVNINTLRTGLPANVHKVLFVTNDMLAESAIPVDVYDKTGADASFGEASQAGRMIVAAVKTNRLVNAQAISLLASTQFSMTNESNQALGTESDEVLAP
ncbi:MULTISPECIES: phage tail protein [Acinetobacter]|uniref:phage tail protein n=1 Tax=Acinetobacter TaxID=469 RepID=UPI00168D87B0|nr:MULTISPECIES: phage tail protein [Acinetobacter]MEB3835732.1 phage tail protein [Acinetobacter sp. IK25]QNX03343.1 phage tail protein [Acinetobacter seifertii]